MKVTFVLDNGKQYTGDVLPPENGWPWQGVITLSNIDFAAADTRIHIPWPKIAAVIEEGKR